MGRYTDLHNHLLGLENMIPKERNPFMGQVNWQHNACVTNHMQFCELGRLYRQSADTLVAVAVENSSTLDVHVYAICFLYRHSIELLLKDLIWKSTYAAHGEKRFPKKHRLPDLWKELCSRLGCLASSDKPLTQKQETEVAEFLSEVSKHDQESDGFRYPYDKRMRRTHQELVHVNLPLLKERVDVVVDTLLNLYELVNWHYDQRSESEAEQSRCTEPLDGVAVPKRTPWARGL
jgi:hypothetical protein